MNLFGRGKNSGEQPTLAGQTPNPEILPFPDSPLSEKPSSQSEVTGASSEDTPPSFGEAPPVSESSEADPAQLPALIAGLEVRLMAAFDQKLATDSYKEKQIDRLHEELQSYKADLVAKAIRPMTSALIKVHAGAVRAMEVLSKQDPSKLTVERISSLFDSFRDEVETALTDQDIRAFQTASGNRFDPRRHVPIKTVPAPSPELVGIIVRSLGSGFEQAGVIIEREYTEVYSENTDQS
jgi:hypothetical protein